MVESGDYPSYSAASREVAMLKQCGDHPNIVKLLNAFEHRTAAGRHVGMVFEAAGDNLSSVMARHAGGAKCGLPLGTVKSITKQLLTALDHLHT